MNSMNSSNSTRTFEKTCLLFVTIMFQALSDEVQNLKTANIQQDLTIQKLLEFIGQNSVLDIGELFNAGTKSFWKEILLK